MDELPQIIATYLAAYNRKDVAAMLATMHPDIVFVNEQGGAITAQTDGKAALDVLAKQAATLFEDREQRVTNAIAAGNMIALRIAYRAKLAADLPNGWRAGQVIELTGTSFITLKDGLIVSLRDIA